MILNISSVANKSQNNFIVKIKDRFIKVAEFEYNENTINRR